LLKISSKKYVFLLEKDDGPSIEEFLKAHKSEWKEKWKHSLFFHFREDVSTWWKSLDHVKMTGIFDEAMEKLILDRWSQVRKQDKES